MFLIGENLKNQNQETTHSLQFQNMEVLDQEAAVSENILDVQSKWQPSWEHIARYFLEYKSTILTVSILTPFLLFSLFQNRLYKSQVGFKIEPGQDLTSNILSDSLLGIRPNKNSLDNIPERALITARSTSFYQELSDIVIEHRDHKHIKFKLGEERKGWVEFLKKKLLGKIEVDGKERLHSRISEQLEQVVKVKKEGESNIIFTVATKNLKLTKDIQNLIKRNASELMVKDPLEEARSALQIIENSEASIFKELDELDASILKLQSEFKTLIPQELPARYSSMRLEIEKGILSNKTKERQLQQSIQRLVKLEKQADALDYSVLRRKEEKVSELASLIAATKHLKSSLTALELDYKELPEFSSKIEKYTLRKKILLEKLNKLTEQISLAKISYEKVKTSITDLNVSEKVQVTSTVKIIAKTAVVSLFVVGLLLSALYYKQSLFPILMSKEQLVLPKNLLAATMPKLRTKRRNGKSLGIHPRTMALDNLYKTQLQNLKWISLCALSKNSNVSEEVEGILESILSKGKSVTLIILDGAKLKKSAVRRVINNYATSLNVVYLKSKSDKYEFPNIKLLRKTLNNHNQSDYQIVLTHDLETSPDGLIMSQVVERSFILAQLFHSTEKSVKRFNQRKSELAGQLRDKFTYILTNAITYDDIRTFIYPSGYSKDEKHEVSKAS